jgi:hypothetical protein
MSDNDGKVCLDGKHDFYVAVGLKAICYRLKYRIGKLWHCFPRGIHSLDVRSDCMQTLVSESYLSHGGDAKVICFLGPGADFLFPA